MKTNFKRATSAIFIVLFFCNLSVYGKNSKSDKQTFAMGFYSTDSILVVTTDTFLVSDSDKKDIESYIYFENWQKKPIYLYKKESEVISTDKKKHILFYGSFCCFQQKDFLRIPIMKTSKGFKFNNQVFNQPTDAFYFINEKATRMYICWNSKQRQTGILSIGIGVYPLHIFRGNEIVLTGTYM